MSRFINFTNRVRNNERAKFWGKVLMFYILFMTLWFYFVLSKDASAPVFIYEEF